MSSLQTCLCSGRGGEVPALPTCNSMGREEKHLIEASETPKKDAVFQKKPNFTRSSASRNQQAKAFWAADARLERVVRRPRERPGLPHICPFCGKCGKSASQTQPKSLKAVRQPGQCSFEHFFLG